MRSIPVVPAQAGGNSGVKREVVGGVVGGSWGRKVGCAYLVGIAGVSTGFSLVTAWSQHKINALLPSGVLRAGRCVPERVPWPLESSPFYVSIVHSIDRNIFYEQRRHI